MKAFIKIVLITLLIVVTDSVGLLAQVYVKKDTTMTFSVDTLNSVPANYTWSVTPAIPGFTSGNKTSQTIKWSGNTSSLYTLNILPVAISGCEGDTKSMDIKLYDNTIVLPINVSWGVNPSAFCPIDTATKDSIVVNGLINISGYNGPYTLTYRIDNNTPDTVSFNTNSAASITFNKGWNNFSNSDFVYHYIRITRIEAGTITQVYSDADAPVLTVTINPVPAMQDIDFGTK